MLFPAGKKDLSSIPRTDGLFELRARSLCPEQILGRGGRAKPVKSGKTRQTFPKRWRIHQTSHLGLIPFFLLYSFRQQVMSQLQMRSLHTKSITEPPRFGDPRQFGWPASEVAERFLVVVGCRFFKPHQRWNRMKRGKSKQIVASTRQNARRDLWVHPEIMDNGQASIGVNNDLDQSWARRRAFGAHVRLRDFCLRSVDCMYWSGLRGLANG
jgi:hypothetical protein